MMADAEDAERTFVGVRAGGIEKLVIIRFIHLELEYRSLARCQRQARDIMHRVTWVAVRIDRAENHSRHVEDLPAEPFIRLRET